MIHNRAVDTVIFDLGGVLIDWNPEYLFRKIFDDEAEMRYFLSEVASPAWNEQQDGGRPLAEATGWLVERHPEYEAEIRAYYGRWEEMLGGAVEETAALLHRLHRQNSHRLYALTNWSAETFPLTFGRFAFLRLFEGILVSGAEKLRKPDPRIYHLLLERYRIDPARALFIDDSPRNVAAAEAAGIAAVRYHSAPALEQFLENNGILRR